MQNRNSSSIARLNANMTMQSTQDRKLRTRTLIQVGGLVNLSGLLEICDIHEGEDLQYSPASQEKAALLLGILLDAGERILDKNAPHELERFKKFGKTMLKKSSAKVSY